MKRSLSLLLSFVMLLLPCLTMFAGCGPVEKDAYEITFSVNGNKTSATVKAGEVPEYTGDVEWETSEHYYKITGWDKEFAPAKKDVTYTAIVGEYGLTLYDVLFILGGNKYVKVKTHEGEIPTPPTGYETDDTRAKEFGTFSKWEPELSAPTAENTENGKKMKSFTARYNYEPKYLAEILPVKNGAKGILTMTYDDGKYATAVWVNEENKKYGLNGSCMMVPNWGGSYPNFTNDGGTIDKWNALFAEGTLEPQSHSMTHERIIPDENWGADEEKWKNYEKNWLQEIYDEELVQAKTVIETAFPGFDCIGFAPSNNTLSTKSYKSDGKGNRVQENGKYVLLNDGGAEKVAEDTYFAIRKGKRTVQSLDPTLDNKEGGWYNLCIRAFKDYKEQADKLSNGKSWLDQTVNEGNWLIVMCHAIGIKSGGDIIQEYADKFFAYAGQYVAEGKLWCATFSEATKYLREKQNTTVSERYDKKNNVVYVDMKINRTTGDGKFLDPTVFNYPLTVEVRVPSHWQNVRIGDATTYTQVEVREDGCYVLANLVPGADGVTVTTAIRP